MPKPVRPFEVSTSQITAWRCIGFFRSGTLTSKRCSVALMDLIFMRFLLLTTTDEHAVETLRVARRTERTV